MALSSCSGSDASDKAVEGSRWASVEEMAEVLQGYPRMPKDERDRLTAEMLQEAGGDFAQPLGTDLNSQLATLGLSCETVACSMADAEEMDLSVTFDGRTVADEVVSDLLSQRLLTLAAMDPDGRGPIPFTAADQRYVARLAVVAELFNAEAAAITPEVTIDQIRESIGISNESVVDLKTGEVVGRLSPAEVAMAMTSDELVAIERGRIARRQVQEQIVEESQPVGSGGIDVVDIRMGWARRRVGQHEVEVTSPELGELHGPALFEDP